VSATPRMLSELQGDGPAATVALAESGGTGRARIQQPRRAVGRRVGLAPPPRAPSGAASAFDVGEARRAVARARRRATESTCVPAFRGFGSRGQAAGASRRRERVRRRRGVPSREREGEAGGINCRAACAAETPRPAVAVSVRRLAEAGRWNRNSALAGSL
jgi:hypothetical protein